ncbi:MAG: GPR endopeptidase [Bacilli bacterium]|nr:GPR endopeptidase [Bacilli bacterium]
MYKNRIIKFKKIDDKVELSLLKELLILFKEVQKIHHILIIGIGNDNYIADAIGPKTLKNIKVNYFNNKIKVSSLEPGTLSETGISTFRIIKSLVKEIKPDLIILIDSFITDDINLLNKSIILNNHGITSNMGIKKLNDSINSKTLHTNVITIGIPTVLELKLKNTTIPYILSKRDVDLFVNDISNLISNVLNKIIYKIL